MNFAEQCIVMFCFAVLKLRDTFGQPNWSDEIPTTFVHRQEVFGTPCYERQNLPEIVGMIRGMSPLAKNIRTKCRMDDWAVPRWDGGLQSNQSRYHRPCSWKYGARRNRAPKQYLKHRQPDQKPTVFMGNNRFLVSCLESLIVEDSISATDIIKQEQNTPIPTIKREFFTTLLRLR